MMKLKFDDVFEYVRAGEDDPRMRETLRLSPDGPELLKQARFICKMMERRAASPDIDTEAARMSFGARDNLALYDDASLEAASETGDSGEVYRLEVSRSDERLPEVSRMLEESGRNIEELGELTITWESGQVIVSFSPSTSVMDRFGKPYLLKYMGYQQGIDGIEIRGAGITMILPDVLATGESMSVHVTRGRNGPPERHLDLIFMPDSGPFSRLTTDNSGLVELPVPDQSGTLRFDTPTPQLLHIKIKK